MSNWLEHLSCKRRGSSSARPLRISFDLDDTLTSHCDRVQMESGWFPGFIHRWLGEPLRDGTYRLMRELRRRGCSIWVYTSSSRSAFHIRRWLLLHGIRLDGVVNSSLHYDASSKHQLPVTPSKFPPAFGIDLHIDDSEGVRMEGERLGFRVLVVDPYDPLWADKVLAVVSRLQATI